MIIKIAGCKCAVPFADEMYCSLSNGGCTVVFPATARTTHTNRVHSERGVMIEIAGCKCAVLFADEMRCSLSDGSAVVFPATACTTQTWCKVMAACDD